MKINIISRTCKDIYVAIRLTEGKVTQNKQGNMVLELVEGEIEIYDALHDCSPKDKSCICIINGDVIQWGDLKNLQTDITQSITVDRSNGCEKEYCEDCDY